MKDGFKGERAIVIPKMILDMIGSDYLTSLLHVTDIGYYPAASNHYRERLEPIDQYVLIYCMEGEGFYSVGDGHSFKVKANQYFILPKGVPHKYGTGNINPWTIYWVHFRGAAAHAYCPASLAPADIIPGIKSRISDRIGLFEEILSTLESGYSIDNLRYASSLLHTFLGSLRFISQYREAIRRDESEQDMANAVIHYMKENIEKHLTLKDLADYAGYSASHFSSLFRSKTGHSPLTYFNLLKVQKACVLLDTTQMKITQISQKLGVSDTYYFTRMFTKIMGTSPSAYRKTGKG